MNNMMHNSFSICLFQFSTCFEQPCAHHQENQLCQYNIWYMSLCIGDCLVCRSGRNWLQFLPDLHTRRSPTRSDIFQMLYWHNWFSWWWAWGCLKHVENWNKHTEKELCIKLVIYKNYTQMHSQQNIKNRDKVSDPYKEAGKIMVLHILIRMSLYMWWEDKKILKTEVTAFRDFSLCEYNFHLLLSCTNTWILLALFCHKCVLYFDNNI
jgi:hypothetical protein